MLKERKEMIFRRPHACLESSLSNNNIATWTIKSMRKMYILQINMKIYNLTI